MSKSIKFRDPEKYAKLPIYSRKILDRLEDLEMTQAELASKLHISKESVTKWVNGWPMSATKLDEVCEKLDCDLSFLLGVNDLPTNEIKFVHDIVGINEASIKALKESHTLSNALNSILCCDPAIVEELFQYLIKYIFLPDVDSLDLFARGTLVNDFEDPTSKLIKVAPWVKTEQTTDGFTLTRTKPSILFAKKNEMFSESSAVDLDIDLFQRALLDRIGDCLTSLRKQAIKNFQINKITSTEDSQRLKITESANNLDFPFRYNKPIDDKTVGYTDESLAEYLPDEP